MEVLGLRVKYKLVVLALRVLIILGRLFFQVLLVAGQGLYGLGLLRTLDIGDGRLLAFSVGTIGLVSALGLTGSFGALILVFAFGLVENLVLSLIECLVLVLILVLVLVLVENLILGLLSALRGVVNYALGGGSPEPQLPQ